MNTRKQIQGKKNRASGAIFENKYSLANKKRWSNPEYKKRVGLSISKSLKGRIGSMKGKHHSKKVKEKIRRSIYHKNLKGTKKGILNPMYGTKMSKEKKRKFNFKGRKHSEETKRKQRISAIKYINRVRGYCSPNRGRNENQILDYIKRAIFLNHLEIIKQYYIIGYFVDGYVPELNLVIEVDEKAKTNKRDKFRQREIEKELGCSFMRINDY